MDKETTMYDNDMFFSGCPQSPKYVSLPGSLTMKNDLFMFYAIQSIQQQLVACFSDMSVAEATELVGKCIDEVRTVFSNEKLSA